ncbi:MAG: extracellular solute-binding protein [Ktedonobacterales bacterium]|nr:extracellular solute-binding protein [Ktedonobacterales bacterium]
MTSAPHRRTPIVSGLLALLTLATLLLTACGSSTSTGNDPNAPITVWVDATRQDAVKLYQKAHPTAKLNVQVVDRALFPGKILLFNNTGQGWPDVVFAEPNLVAQVADSAHHFPLDLTPYVSSDIVNNFAGLAECQFDGKLYCLRNDLAQNVVWYNKALMDQFGYTVPTTWEDYQALGLKVAKEHPGYTIGAFGDSQALNVYLAGSNCPIKDVLANSQVYINTADPNCARAASLVDTLISAKALSTKGPFDPDYVAAANANKVLMLVAASWYGEYVFKGTYYKAGTQAGALAVAPPLKWAADSQTYTGGQGGAAWVVSNHVKNRTGAVDLVTWLATSNDNQGAAPTYPAYKPAAAVWQSTLASNPQYSTNPFPVLQQAASDLYPAWAPVRYDPDTAFTNVVIAAVQKGQTVTSSLPDYQKALVPLAQAQGYDVVTTKP